MFKGFAYVRQLFSGAHSWTYKRRGYVTPSNLGKLDIGSGKWDLENITYF